MQRSWPRRALRPFRLGWGRLRRITACHRPLMVGPSSGIPGTAFQCLEPWTGVLWPENTSTGPLHPPGRPLSCPLGLSVSICMMGPNDLRPDSQGPSWMLDPLMGQNTGFPESHSHSQSSPCTRPGPQVGAVEGSGGDAGPQARDTRRLSQVVRGRGLGLRKPEGGGPIWTPQIGNCRGGGAKVSLVRPTSRPAFQPG